MEPSAAEAGGSPFQDLSREMRGHRLAVPGRSAADCRDRAAVIGNASILGGGSNSRDIDSAVTRESKPR